MKQRIQITIEKNLLKESRKRSIDLNFLSYSAYIEDLITKDVCGDIVY